MDVCVGTFARQAQGGLRAAFFRRFVAEDGGILRALILKLRAAPEGSNPNRKG